jgi:serine/threonine protein kinase
MPRPESARPFEEAEKEFLAYRRRREAGEVIDFEAFCAERPEIAENLRLLDSAFDLGKRSAVLLSLSFRDLVAQEFGEDQLANLSLDREPEAGKPQAAGAPLDDAGRYLDRGEVDRGGMSRILRVWDRDLGRDVAMKVALERTRDETKSSPSRTALERFLGEAHVTARLDHPGIVPVHDVGFDREGHAFFTMRLVKGRSFRAVIDLARAGKEGWSIQRAAGCLLKVCQTVAFAHAKGVIHRDLKPANIMVGSFGETYVVDWGLARVLGEKDRHAVRLRFAPGIPLSTVETRRTGMPSEDPEDPLVTPAGTVVGTPVFMPPEQAAGDLERVNQTSDVYALGTILYTLLAGRPPYAPPDGKGSPFAILGQVIKGPPTPVLDIDPAAPRDLVAVCERAMARRQEDRHRDSLELAADLELCLEGEPVRGGNRGVPAARRRRSAAAVLGSALIGAGIAAAVFALAARGRGGSEGVVLADLQRLADLEAAAEGLGPAVSANVEPMRAWLERARSWAQHAAAEHRTALAAIASPPGSGQPRPGTDLERLAIGLARFTAPDASGGVLARVERRFAFARQSRKKTIEDSWQLWQDARTAIADERACPAYAGFDLTPQEGLIPIGPDRESGLWEFGHLETGRIAERDAAGRLASGPDTGLVFVLIPGGSAGEPLFISRHPMTRAQWQRVTRGAEDRAAGEPGLPATRISWHEAHDVLRGLGLTLPAAADRQRAAAAANARGTGGPGALRDLAGGVREWCLDWEPERRGKVIAGGGRHPAAGTETPFEFAAPEYRSDDLGLRPARAVSREGP